ncbi:hypothetical protein Hanom_Chr12g01129771 [Helianthus anomalus]
MCRQQKERQESASHENCIKPTMVEIKLNISTQHICYDYPAKIPKKKKTNGLFGLSFLVIL